MHDLIAELHSGVDWVLVEGFKHSDLPKIEVWRKAQAGDATRPLRYVDDALVVGIATDVPQALPKPTSLPVFDVNDAGAVVRWLRDNAERFAYNR